MIGRLEEAREFAVLHERAGEALSPHHRVHSFGLLCEIEDAAGDELVGRADELFVERGLEWHRAQTELLLAGL